MGSVCISGCRKGKSPTSLSKTVLLFLQNSEAHKVALVWWVARKVLYTMRHWQLRWLLMFAFDCIFSTSKSNHKITV